MAVNSSSLTKLFIITIKFHDVILMLIWKEEMKKRTCLTGVTKLRRNIIITCNCFIMLKMVYQIHQTLCSVVARPANRIPRRPQHRRKCAADWAVHFSLSLSLPSPLERETKNKKQALPNQQEEDESWNDPKSWV